MAPCAECKAFTCWTERTKLEKWLIPSLILIGALALALVFTCFYLAGWFTKSKTETPVINEENKKSDFPKSAEIIPSNDNVCKTPSCIFAANTILDNMDPTISPCDNFYDFACGNFVKKKIIPEDQSDIDPLGLLSVKVMEEMKIMLEEPLQKGEPKPFQLMKKYYKTCMDTDAMEKNGLNTIQSILKDFGGWPLLEGDNWVEKQFDWKELSYKFHNVGFVDTPLFQVFVDTHLQNHSRRVLYITDKAKSVKVSFRKRLWTDDEVRKAYFQYMVDAAVLLGADKNKSITEIRAMFDFQVKLWDLQKQEEPGEEMNVNQLQQKIPYISWVDYINKLLAPHVKISGDDVVFVFKKRYLKDLESFLLTNSKRALANQMIWSFVEFSAPYSNKALREAYLKFTEVGTGTTIQPARWIYCAEDYIKGRENVDKESLYIGAGALFVRKYFNNKTKQEAQEMISNIHHTLQDTMKNIDWMDEKTKKNALDKLEAMLISIAYPEEFLDDKKLEEFYGDLNLDENDYLKSFLKLKQFDIRNHYRRLREPVDRNDWVSRGIVVGTVNANYQLMQNGINIPAAILQDEMFDSNRPHYLNYGAIGFIIGHEFTHGFDTKGSKRDKYGNKFNWWTPETENLFLNKSQCFVEQYNKYVVPELNLTVNGNLTVGENIADNGGISVSYKAYQEFIKRQGPDKTLPSLNYTQNQLFWLAAANTLCSKSRIEYQQYLLFNDVHSPSRFRVIGFLSNNKDFSKDFRCSSESKMNPKHKCKLW